MAVELSWKLHWERIWPEDSSWLDDVLQQGFTPVLAGKDLIEEMSKENPETQSKVLVLGLVPMNESSQLKEEILESFLSKIHKDHVVDKDTNEVHFPKTDTLLITGLLTLDYWQEELTDPAQVIKKEFEEWKTAIMFYGDPDKSIHEFSSEEEQIYARSDGGFIVELPKKIGTDETWAISRREDSSD